MTKLPGADERRVASILRRRGVGPDGDPVMPYQLEERWNAAVAAESEPVRDWLDDILDDNTDEPPGPAEHVTPKASVKGVRKAKPASKKRRKRKRRKPGAPRTAWDTQPQSPRQSLLDAWKQLPCRLKWLISHTTAAAIGWRLGMVGWSTNTAAWFAAGHWTSFSAYVLYGLGAGVLALYRHTRGWAWPVALLCAVPVSSVVAGVLLYGTGYHH